MNPIRSLLAIVVGVAVISIVVEPLEFTLVNALADGPIQDMAGYFAVRNSPVILAAKLVYNTLAAVLGGYMCAKIAGHAERTHGVAAAILQTGALVYGFTSGEYAAFTPVWMRVALVLLMGPAILAGATVRAKARSAS